MAEGDSSPLSFIYGGTTGLTLEELRRREAIATAMASQRQPYPKTVGEGLTALGQAFGRRMYENRLREAEQNYYKQKAATMAGANPQANGVPLPTNAPPGTAPPAAAGPNVVPNAFTPLGMPGQYQPGPPSSGSSVAAPPPAVTPAAPPPAAAAAAPPPASFDDRFNALPPGPRAMAYGGDDETTDQAPDNESGATLQKGPFTEADDMRNRIAALVNNPKAAMMLANYTPQGVAQTNPTDGAESPPQPGGQPSGDGRNWTARQNAIGGIESGGRKNPYATVGVETRGDRPYGRYGIMGRNIPEWTAVALGRAMTPVEFFASFEVQDAMF